MKPIPAKDLQRGDVIRRHKGSTPRAEKVTEVSRAENSNILVKLKPFNGGNDAEYPDEFFEDEKVDLLDDDEIKLEKLIS